ASEEVLLIHLAHSCLPLASCCSPAWSSSPSRPSRSSRLRLALASGLCSPAASALTIKGNQWMVTVAGRGGKNGGRRATSAMTFKIDTSKSPKWLDLVSPPNGKESRSLGIYKLEGDTLTL